MVRQRARQALGVVIGALAVTACDANQSGHTGATKFGDVSHPAERGSPLAALQAACGATGALLDGAGVLHRHPYLQQVTSASAMIGWVSVSAAEQRAEITRPAGELVASVVATAEATAVRTAGELQMWTRADALQADTTYCYRILLDGVPVTERIGFRTAPIAEATAPIRFLAFGDSGGGGSDQFALRPHMEDVPYELVIHTGDLAYDSGTITQLEETVFAVYDELFRHLAFYPAPGNHDYRTDDGAPFRDVFALPDNGEGEKWYSYDWGRVHFVALDTESDYRTQAAWLDRDLEATTLPWRIVYLHRPPYSSGHHGSDLALRTALAPVLEARGVQLLLAGHDHDYERMKPQRGVQYVVTGGGGRGTYAVGHASFSAFSESVIHFVYVEVGVDELVLHAIDAEGTEFDSVVVPR